MAKPRMYGMIKRGAQVTAHTACMWQKKLQKQRNRERAPRNVVAGRIPKEKEGQA